MHYYDVLVSGLQYHGRTAITYASDTALEPGRIVMVPLRQQLVLAVLQRSATKPNFDTKQIAEIINLPALPKACLQLIEWMQSYYPSTVGSIVQQFLPKSLSNKLLENFSPSNLQEFIPKITPPPLTAEQKGVLTQINGAGTYLLHGETGSGKTRIYEELARKALKDNQSAIILTPEISLTAQLKKNFETSFGSQVVVVHSHLTPAERRNIWLTLLMAKKPYVVIGARSALFSPLKNIGLIVVDEEHESAYKQERSPYYNAVRVASQLSDLHKSILVLGSATPSIVDYFIAEQKRAPILRMEKPAFVVRDGARATITTVDLKQRSEFKRSNYLSDALIAAIKNALDKKEQALLFLNRRGTARIMLCSVCGWQAVCPNCDTPLTYHGDKHIMRCHICNYHSAALAACPVCQNTDIVFKGVGTKAIVDEARKIFPQATVQRFDADNLKSERFEQQYENVAEGKVDILVGTQTLAKGLDLPNLSVVGVITADTSLYTPDYTAQERMYQLVSQVIGRVARGHRPGQAIIQTYQPGHAVLRAALQKDWTKFYKSELAERQQFLFPPFAYLLKLTCRRATPASAQRTAEKLAELLTAHNLKLQIDGPAPSFHERNHKQFEWQLVIKSKSRPELLKVIDMLPSGWSYNIDPIDLL